MKRMILTRFTIMFFLTLFFITCKESAEVKKELWAVVINFFSPDATYYPVTKKFPFPDTLRYGPLDVFFTNQNRPPIISDSNIIFYDTYRTNGKKECCKQDTLEKYVDTIGGKKYLFAIGEYIAVFQSNDNSDTNLRSRKDLVSIPLWNIRLNTPYPPEKFKNEYEKLGMRYVKLREEFDEVSKQKWNDNDSISVETIQFNNSSERMITAVHRDMSQAAVDSTIADIRNKFPALRYQETIQRNSDGQPIKIIRMLFHGISITFTQIDPTTYTFMITDYYETIKLIIKNAGPGYIFRDDIKIY